MTLKMTTARVNKDELDNKNITGDRSSRGFNCDLEPGSVGTGRTGGAAKENDMATADYAMTAAFREGRHLKELALKQANAEG